MMAVTMAVAVLSFWGLSVGEEGDFGRILSPQGQNIAPQVQFNGVAHRRDLADLHPGLRGESHIQKAPPQGPLPSN